MTPATCILFATTTSQILIPPQNVQSLVKDRIKSQYEIQNPGLKLDFDTSDCKTQGEYSFGMQTISLESNSFNWQGKKIFQIGDILDGVKLEFPIINQKSAAKKEKSWDEPFLHDRFKSPHPQNRALLWILGAVTLTTAGILIANQSHTIDTTKGNTAPDKSGESKTSLTRGKTF